MSLIWSLQKASIWKRISAWLLDAILLVILSTLCAWIISAVLDYDRHVEKLAERKAFYEAEYGVELDITQAEYETLEGELLAATDAAFAAINADVEAVYASETAMWQTLVISSLSILIAFMVMEFAVPLFLRDGQTVGKKVFGICLMRIDGVRITPLMLFIRTLLGKYTMETMLPVMSVLCIQQLGYVGLTMAAAVLIGNAVLFAVSEENAMLHDKMACTAVVDKASQRIFDTPEALLAFKTQQAAGHP